MYELCAETLGCHLIWWVETPYIVKERHYSSYHLQWGVAVDSGESLQFFLKESPRLKSKNQPCILSTTQQENVKSVKKVV